MSVSSTISARSKISSAGPEIEKGKQKLDANRKLIEEESAEIGIVSENHAM